MRYVESILMNYRYMKSNLKIIDLNLEILSLKEMTDEKEKEKLLNYKRVLSQILELINNLIDDMGDEQRKLFDLMFCTADKMRISDIMAIMGISKNKYYSLKNEVIDYFYNGLDTIANVS